jgi:hypothetical protein
MLHGAMQEITSLNDTDKESMVRIMNRHYANVSREMFLKDLSEKDGVLSLADDQGRIQGFSTYLFMQTTYRGDAITALFSGDTIIDNEYWGSQALFRIFGRLLFKLMDEHRGTKTYWFLITKGYRTYLMLPLFFNNFYPRVDQETPPYEHGLIEHLANAKYNGHFHPERGIIAADSYYLKGEFAEVPDRKRNNRNVRFFLEKNPGYIRGEELACVCEIQPESFRKRTKKLVRP